MGNVIWTPNVKDSVDGAKLHRSNSLLASANIASSVIGSDAAEAGSTADKIVATAHAARVGDIIRITSGTHDDIEVRVLKVPDANTIIVEALSSAIGVTDTFDILRPQTLTVDASGNLNVTASAAGSYAEDSVHASGDLGAAVLAVRNDANAVMTSADGDYGNLTVDSTGRLRVDATIIEAATAADGAVGLPALVKVVAGYDGANVQAIATDASGNVQVDVVAALPAGTNNIGDVDVLTLPGGLTGYAEDSAHASGDIGVMPLAVRSDAGGALAGTDGDYSPLQVDATGNLRVTASISAEAATAADGGALPAVVKVIGGYDGANVQAIATDASGNLQADILTLPGNLTGYAEDAAHASGDIGVMPLAVRQDTTGTLAGATGDYAPLQVDASGMLKVSAPSGLVLAGKSVVTTVRNDYTSTSVTTGAWVQLVASLGAAVTELEIFDSSGETLELGTGAAAAETRLILVVPGGNGRVPVAIAAATRLSIRAVSATASVGELDINIYGV